MLTYIKYLVESSLEVDKLMHLEHAEDHIIHGGEEGLVHTADNLQDLNDRLLGGNGGKSKITTKYDGSPAIIFGINPENNMFFVASKSAFNKNPKINYSIKDIEKNHGHAPGLVSKLKAALEHLPKIMPTDKKDNPTGVYQGDFLYEKSDIEDSNNEYKFAPNTITYSANKDSSQGRKIKSSKIGFVIHTKYVGKKLHDMKAGFDVNHNTFKQNPLVNLINPEVNDLSKVNYTPDMQKKYQGFINTATSLYRDTDSQVFTDLKQHELYLKTYINQTVRDGSKPSIKDYANFLSTRKAIDVAGVKMESTKQKKAEAYDQLLSDLTDNKKDYEKVLGIHYNLQVAKDILITALGNPTELKHIIGGKEVKPEGFVSIRNGRPTKLVDRAEFSRLNFANNRGRGDEESPSPNDSKIIKPHVMAFGRLNPPTTGHGAVVDKIKELAGTYNADHSLIISNTVDPEKNPLTPEQKVKHAKRMFPDTNIIAAGKDAPSFIDHAKKLFQSGVDHLVMVAGSDRVDEYKKILNKYNGPTGQFNFKKVDVVSAGSRDPDAEGIEGMSASKMRGHAIRNNFHSFRAGIPNHVSDNHARQMFQEVRKGSDIRIGPETSGISLARYAKRNDPIGVKARAEQKRRQIAKNIRKPVIKTNIKEEIIVSNNDKKLVYQNIISHIRNTA